MMSDTQHVNVTAVINESRISGYQWLIIALSLLTAMFDGYDTQGIAYVAPVIAQDLGMNVAQLGPIFGAGLVGLMIGAIFFGMLADKIGRKQAIMWSVLVFGIFSILTPFGESFRGLLILRFLAGIGLGGALPNTIAYILEYAPVRMRGLLVNSPNAFFALGSIVGGLLATKLIPAFGWQSTFYVGGVVPLLFLLVIALWLPESARFLLVKGRSPERIARIMQKIAPARQFTPTTRFILEPEVSGITVKHLFTEGRAYATVQLWLAFFMNLFVLLYLINWMPTLLRQAGQPLQTAILLTVWYNIGGFLGGLAMGWIADRSGAPHTVLAVAYVGAAVFITTAAFSIDNLAILLPAMFFTGVSINGGQASLNTIAATYYPTAIRATGIGWALGIGRIGSILGPIMGGIFVGAGWSVSSVILVNIVPAVIAAASILFLRRHRTAEVAALAGTPSRT
jgi:AAHS family 4-hydroxybenzoate transporter-like MFS transporter